ncbi:MAG: T9SS type A sorting domain-containing protein [Ignavibacteria bacterium]
MVVDDFEQSQILYDDPKEKYDKNIFTKEDRKEIKTNVFKSFETGRDKEIEIVKTLEKKVSEGNANENEKKELETKKILKEIAKPKKPINISEHINNVSSDINKITDAGKGSLENKNANIVPEVYYLSQNYPNPFNPSTRISFDLPVDSKVKLIVYDMLGREVKSMVNTQLYTGRYEFQFEGSNFSSGIYFYRMEAVDNSGKKFVQTKRMVLVK